MGDGKRFAGAPEGVSRSNGRRKDRKCLGCGHVHEGSGGRCPECGCDKDEEVRHAQEEG